MMLVEKLEKKTSYLRFNSEVKGFNYFDNKIKVKVKILEVRAILVLWH